MTGPVGDAQLNAFVDGELASAEAAQVAQAIAEDPALARRAAHLHQMKAALAGYGANLPLPDLPRGKTAPAAPPRRKAMRAMMAAALALVGLLGLTSISSPPPEGADPGTPLLALHDQWLQQDGAAPGLALPDGYGWIAPVMQASGLQLVTVQQDARGTHLGFKGPNACRLSLRMTPGQDATPLALTLAEDIQHAHWQAGGLAFEMLARDMALPRFATVATGLHQGSRALGGDAALRIALIESARLPCLA
ncbi:hypothetical protein HUK65_06370 [Rhodobacteraceae bacterium 2376]|uniref:Anti-sigma factor n=1 Tax=Rhabdonatronobacter sediminivivens TaxID=2743469 RepID=A0A7Z0HYI3_9RHOB|nr:hypothetical protein [Rhabdonatronobacter sediminivivens]NYS24612.1 hypothetical protein [Rhabdonatronobacter sediminivivens]